MKIIASTLQSTRPHLSLFSDLSEGCPGPGTQVSCSVLFPEDHIAQAQMHAHITPSVKRLPRPDH